VIQLDSSNVRGTALSRERGSRGQQEKKKQG